MNKFINYQLQRTKLNEGRYSKGLLQYDPNFISPSNEINWGIGDVVIWLHKGNIT
jgi:hypothetical protein